MGGGEAVGAAAGVALAIGFGFARAFHPSRKVTRRFEEFLDDWNGQPERRTPDGEAVLSPRRPGVPERLGVMEQTQQGDSARLTTIEEKLNGGGLGSQLAAVDAKITDHIAGAEGTRDQILDEVAAVKEQVAETQRFTYRLAQGQDELKTQVNRLDETVQDRLFVVEDAERTHRAMLHEVGFDIDLPTPPDDDA